MSEAIIKVTINDIHNSDKALIIERGKATINQEYSGDPDISLSCNSDDFPSLVIGELEPVRAFMTGKLAIQGDKAIAVELLGLLNSVSN